ncbi:hypothetical protein [Butyrivibrio sp. INlla21]|uniref:hypothetical protein n=1 Tax=Butyrivibrio sp. INlla21 TaxID=1520811 RepID=UPI0008F2CBC7|nr:hypothetical protein [Butyrivibrio sp. INlla21]SFU37520.1 hypothetical protein SAMN02910342_00309 [Butyrivibrio sp. INlla21]
MGYDSLRNKEVVKFPNGKLMMFAEISDSRTFDDRGRRIWTKILVHPDGTLFYTKESLKKTQTEYVERNLKKLREFSRNEIATGWAKEYHEPTLDDDNFAGTVFPGGRKIRNGKAFYSARKTIDAAEYFGRYDSPRRIIFTAYDKDFNETYRNDYDILAVDVDEAYEDALKENKTVYISLG